MKSNINDFVQEDSMDFKKNTLIKIIFVLLVISAWFILSQYQIKNIDARLGINDERDMIIGHLKNAEGGLFGTQIPKSNGKKIYRWYIEGDTDSINANTLHEKDVYFPENSYERNFIFIGYYGGYETAKLIKENPFTWWLKDISSDLTVFEIEDIFLLENNADVITFDALDALKEEVVLSITVKNVLQKELVDTKVRIFVTSRKLEVIILNDSDSKIPSSSYYETMIKRNYIAGEEKKYKLKIRPRNSQWNLTDFNISVSYEGYALNESTSPAEIIPLYSKKVIEYQQEHINYLK